MRLPRLLEVCQLPFVSLLVHDVGVVELAAQVFPHRRHVFFPELVAFCGLLLRQSDGLCLFRQLVDPVDPFPFHALLPFAPIVARAVRNVNFPLLFPAADRIIKGRKEAVRMKLLILGGGASGMMAALSAAESQDCEITLIERQGRVGRKLMATGNGRCNLTNLHTDETRYHGDHPDFVRRALGSFDVDKTLAFFHRLGLYTVVEPDGKVYPLSDQANSVVDVLRFALEQRGVCVTTSCDILRAGKAREGFVLESATGERFVGDKLIVACGGCAGKTLGGTRAGYRLLASFGHTVTELRPSLVQIRSDAPFLRSLKGVRAQCRLSLKADGRTIASECGEIQFTDYGVSGPVAFSLSRGVLPDGKDQLLLLDLLRETGETALFSSLRARCEAFPDLETEHLLTGMLNTRLGQTVVKVCDLPLREPLSALSDSDLQRLSHLLKFFPIPVTGLLGMEHAQVTAGGVDTSEFRADTLESRIVPGLFATGELLDIDGDCGGFNLQWAWSSGYVAGKLGNL